MTEHVSGAHDWRLEGLPKAQNKTATPNKPHDRTFFK